MHTLSLPSRGRDVQTHGYLTAYEAPKPSLGGRVFNLPLLTTLILIGLPTMWVLYTIGFLWSSRRWSEDDPERER